MLGHQRKKHSLILPDMKLVSPPGTTVYCTHSLQCGFLQAKHNVPRLIFSILISLTEHCLVSPKFSEQQTKHHITNCMTTYLT
jgi:hypothetical protein